MDIKLDQQVADIVSAYAHDLEVTPEKLVNDFLFLYLDTEKEILKCPKCNHPIVFAPTVPIDGKGEYICKHCGKKCIVDFDDYSIKEDTDEYSYDIVFNDDTDSNSVGGNYTLQEAKDYININNGTNWGYFKDYKGGIVSIYCKETGEDVYSEIVK